MRHPATGRFGGDRRVIPRPRLRYTAPPFVRSTEHEEQMAKPRGRTAVKKKRSGPSGQRKRRPQLPPEELDWKSFPTLRRFLSERGKIRSRRITGLSRRQQSQLSAAVKRARTMGLFPYPDQERKQRAR
jgi:small subunit ribosomal protein S18